MGKVWRFVESLAGKLGGGIAKDWPGFSFFGGFGFGFGGKTRSGREMGWIVPRAGKWFGGKTRSGKWSGE